MDKNRDQVEVNYAAFEKMLPDLVTTHRGKFALMRNGEIIEFYDTIRDAYLTGQKLYEDKLFSVQEIVETPVDLGFFSYAIPER